MRDILILASILCSLPTCFLKAFFGVLVSAWVAHFKPRRVTPGMAGNFPVPIVVAIPTLLEILFSFEPNRRFFERPALLVFWV